MKRFAQCSALAAIFILASASAAGAESSSSQTEIAVCPNVMQTTYPQAGVGGIGPGTFGCQQSVFSAGFVFVRPDKTCTTPTDTDLGTFSTTQNPLGIWISVASPNSCATTPPTLGFGAVGGTAIVSVAQTGFCPTSLTVPATIGDHAAVLLPIGTLPLGKYNVRVNFADQTVVNPQTQQQRIWTGSYASGTLRIGTTFTETDTIALARPGVRATLAALLRNSVAGPGAGELVQTRTGNAADLKGTDYYACGMINIAATLTYGKRATKGIVRVTGNGTITGGGGNYTGLKGTFRVKGSYSARTKGQTLVLKGTVTY